MYRPLPDCLSIKPSKIEGLGLFAIKQIGIGTTLGMTHYELKDEPNGYLRTPLGGFINHSDNPNCELYNIGIKKFLVATKDIEPLEELTVTYTMYSV